MRRFLQPMAVALAVLVTATACGADSADDLQVQTEASGETTTSVSDAAGESSEAEIETETAAEAEPEPEADTVDDSTPEPDPEPEVEVEIEADDGSDADQAGSDTADDGDADPEDMAMRAAFLESLADRAAAAGGDPEAAALLVGAVESLFAGEAAHAVRGEVTQGLPVGEFTGSLTARFERDTESDLAVVLDIPAGFDSMFPEGVSTETRYVDGVAYVRLPLDPETLADLGYEGEVWLIPQDGRLSPALADSMGPAAGLMGSTADLMGSTAEMLCVRSSTYLDDCDPLSEFAYFLVAASGAEIVGREEVRGVPATKVRFHVSFAQALEDPFEEFEGMFGGEETSEDEELFSVQIFPPECGEELPVPPPVPPGGGLPVPPECGVEPPPVFAPAPPSPAPSGSPSPQAPSPPSPPPSPPSPLIDSELPELFEGEELTGQELEELEELLEKLEESEEYAGLAGRMEELLESEEYAGLAGLVEELLEVAESEEFESEEFAALLLYGQLVEEILSLLGFDVEIWVDDDMLIRRITVNFGEFFGLVVEFLKIVLEMAEAPMDEVLPMPFPLSLDFYDHGTGIDVEAPPSEAVTDDPDLFRSVPAQEQTS